MKIDWKWGLIATFAGMFIISVALFFILLNGYNTISAIAQRQNVLIRDQTEFIIKQNDIIRQLQGKVNEKFY